MIVRLVGRRLKEAVGGGAEGLPPSIRAGLEAIRIAELWATDASEPEDRVAEGHIHGAPPGGMSAGNDPLDNLP